MNAPGIHGLGDSRRRAYVLTKAVLAASEKLGLTQRALARTLGVSPSSVSRLEDGRRVIADDSKEGELALLVVRAFRGLDALVGGDERAARAWFHSENHHLGGVPGDLVQRAEGLVGVVEYLDAMRGKL